MLDFNKLYNNAATIKKPNKTEAFMLLKDLTEAINDNSEGQIEFNLHKLIAFFNPPAPGKPKSLFDYAAKVAALAKKDVRTYLKYIKVDNDIVIATTGEIMIVVDNDEKLEAGLYHHTRIKSDEDWFPDYAKVLKPVKNTRPVEEITTVTEGEIPVNYTCMDGVYLNSDYVNLITCYDKNGRWDLTEDKKLAVYYFNGGLGLVATLNK